MKFDWKHWLPHFITWFLLLILLGCNIWLIRNELERRKRTLNLVNYPANPKDTGNSDKERKKPEGKPPKKENNEGEKEGNDDK